MDPALAKQLIGAVAVAAGAGALIMNWRNGQLVVRSQDWPSVAGRVLRSEVVQERMNQGGVVFVARIEYEYLVGGRAFRGERVCVGGELHTSLRGRAEARCVLYPVGAEVEVFHDPDRPERACLERTREGGALALLVGNVFVIGGLAMLLGIFG